MKNKYLVFIYLFPIFILFSCQKKQEDLNNIIDFKDYTLARVPLYPSYSGLEEKEKIIIQYLVSASIYADSIFFIQNSGDYTYLLDKINDEKLKLRFKINFGPWDIFHNNLPFIKGIASKPQGAYFYPIDMLSSEFYNFNDSCKYSHYTVLRRNENNELICIPYHIYYKKYLDSAINYIKQAYGISQDINFKNYLNELIYSLQTQDYYKTYTHLVNLDSKIEFIFGPTDITIDKLFNIKADFQAFLLIKDKELSNKLNQYVKWLRYLQKALPVPEIYRQEEPGEQSLIAVYDVVFLGGSAKAGVPLISTTIPFDPEFQIQVGTKNLQFKNVIAAKYEGIIRPIVKKVMIPSQAKYVSSQAFQDLSLLYEIANGLGIRNTINDKGSVINALEEIYAISQYTKNYLMVLFLAEKLHSVNELNLSLKEYYYTFVANLFRGIRWGSENNYGLANLIIINYLIRNGAIKFLPSKQIIVNYEAMKEIIPQMLRNILIIQGNGDKEAMKKFILNNKYISANLQYILSSFDTEKIPIDIYPEFKIKL